MPATFCAVAAQTVYRRAKDKEVIVMRVDGNTVTEEGRILGDEISVFGMCVSNMTATYMC